jgi:hypothetical protein
MFLVFGTHVLASIRATFARSSPAVQGADCAVWLQTNSASNHIRVTWQCMAG